MGIEFLVAATVISGATAAYGQYQAAQTQRRVSDFNAAIARNNAVSAKQWADYNETRTREQQKYRREKMISTFLKAGVDMEGTPSIVLDEQLIQDEMDALVVRRGGQAEAARYGNQANIYSVEGRAAQTAGMIGAGTTLLTTATEVGKIQGGFYTANQPTGTSQT